MSSPSGVRGRTVTDAATTSSPAILLVAENGDAGGIGRYCVDMAAVLRDRASAVCLCPAPCPGPGVCWLTDQCADRGLPLLRVPMPPKAIRSGLTGLLAAWRRTGRPLVHVNGRRGNAVAIGGRLAAPRWRYVTTVHGVLGLHARRNIAYRVVDLLAGRLARSVIAVSVHTHRRLLRAGSRPDRTYLVQNALGEAELEELEAVAARRWLTAPRNGPLRLGFLGRLSPEKGTRELVEVSRQLHRSGADVTVTIAGDGPDRGWMAEASKDMVQSGFIDYRGLVRDVAGFLGEIDVLVMPSHNEGLPYALLEAMAAGCVVVASAVGGIPEVVRDPAVGILRPAGDTTGLAAELRRLADDRAAVVTIGRAAAAHVRSEFALPARIPEIARAYGMDLQAEQRDRAERPATGR